MKKLNIIKNASLKSYNTFGVNASAKQLAIIESSDQVVQALSTESQDLFILGGGSNLLLASDLDLLVLKNNISGIEIIEENDGYAFVKVGGGVVWHELVLWTIEKGLGGLENLSLIPGTVGAAPIQNIGAYGVEQMDVFHSLEAIRLVDGEYVIFDHEQCGFGYRDSFFKNEGKGKYFICSVIYRLTKSPVVNIGYGAIKNTLAKRNIKKPTIYDVSNAVIDIRSSKLPDPSKIGNSGSFFKNPVTTAKRFKELESEKGSIVHYDLLDGRVKIPAGWLIDQCGWKGRREGDVGCYEKQALVIVNHGSATGSEIWSFAQKVQKDVDEKWGILLEPEVNVINC